jgi:HTH-type transcriptional regulator, sugar sensing transcriptional regulator
MDIEILEDIGLTKREISVYIALIELGESTAGPLKHKTKLQNSVIHWCLNNLITKGLVNYVEKGKRKYYQATDPENLIKFLNEKKHRLQELVPQLIKKQGEQASMRIF